MSAILGFLLFCSQDEQDVESQEDDQDEEDLEHKLTIIACVFIDLSDLLLSFFNIVQGFLRILINSLY